MTDCQKETTASLTTHDVQTLGEVLVDFLKSDLPLARAMRAVMNPEQGAATPPVHTPLEQWVDNTEVMRLLNLSPRTMQTLRDKGVLSYACLFPGSSKIYYRRADIERLLNDDYKLRRIKQLQRLGKLKEVEL